MHHKYVVKVTICAIRIWCQSIYVYIDFGRFGMLLFWNLSILISENMYVVSWGSELNVWADERE